MQMCASSLSLCFHCRIEKETRGSKQTVFIPQGRKMVALNNQPFVLDRCLNHSRLKRKEREVGVSEESPGQCTQPSRE